MKTLLLLLFVLQSFSMILNARMNVDFVKDYLKLNKISISSILTCDNVTETVTDVMVLQNDDIWVNVWDISSKHQLGKLDYKHALVRQSATPSVVLNLECNNSIAFMEEISKRKMFHFERFWLVFGDRFDQAFEILRHQFINMDAEIFLVLPANET